MSPGGDGSGMKTSARAVGTISVSAPSILRRRAGAVPAGGDHFDPAAGPDRHVADVVVRASGGNAQAYASHGSGRSAGAHASVGTVAAPVSGGLVELHVDRKAHRRG